MPDYSLYLATDRELIGDRDLRSVLVRAVNNGVTMVQLREKNTSAKAFFEMGVRVHALTQELGIPLIVNDRVDIMLALDAEGVHVGRDDLPLAEVRKLAGNKLVGY
ncbi:MAG: thiamine phosphate synthase, partial [Candidatus Pacebacteria bacterium]|nr:thiamine phosphate synthase [Candidatus Paceibacterota bacterium]